MPTMDKNEFRRAVAIGFAWQGITKFAVQILSWISTFYVARLLAPEDYGVVAIAGALTGAILIFGNLGLAAGLINKTEINQSDISTVFFIGVFTAASLYILLHSTAPFFAAFYPDADSLQEIIRLSSVMLLFGALKIVPFSLAMRDLNFRFRSLADLCTQLVVVALTLILAEIGLGPYSLVLPVIIGEGVSAVVFLNRYRFTLTSEISSASVKEAFRYGGPVIATRLLSFSENQIGNIAAASVFGTRSAGQFYYAQQLAYMPSSKIIELLQRVAFPALSRARADEPLFLGLLSQIHMYAMACMVPLLVGLALCAEDAINVLITAKWVSIVPCVQVLSIAAIFRSSLAIYSIACESLGRPVAALQQQIFSTSTSLLGAFLGAPYGLIGMAVGIALSVPINYVVLLSQTRRITRLPWVDFLASWRPALFCSLFMAGIVALLQLLLSDCAPLYRLVISAVGGGLTYAAAFAAMFPREFGGIRSLFSSGS
jgi:O-antigen/teichoic acid export membrane protein